MKQRYEVKKQNEKFYKVNDNQSTFVTVMPDGSTKPSLFVAVNLTKEAADKLCDRLNLRHAWGV